MSPRRSFLASAALLALVLIAAGGFWLAEDRARGIWRRHARPLFAGPANVAYEPAEPAALGLDAAALETLRAGLAGRETRALVLVRRGRIALEWYAAGTLANDLHETAALAKGVVATSIALAAASDGALALDAPAARYLPAWRADPARAAIRVRDLLSHASGIENVSFPRAKAILEGRREEPGFPDWKLDYYADPGARFRIAVESAPLRFAPGTRYEYSGVGFYALATALESALREAGHPDLRAYLRTRLMEPLGIPADAWSISYDTRYSRDGRHLYALGSGARFSARALARIGELYAAGGRFAGDALLDAGLVELALGNAGLPAARDLAGRPQPSIGLGWWVNDPVQLAALPRDAAFAAGSNHRVLVVVPSWQLVAVRIGGSLGEARWEGAFWDELGRHLAAPLAAAIEERG